MMTVLTYVLMAGLTTIANAGELKGERCSVNTYSATCDVPTGCFDDESFLDNTKKVLLNELRNNGFKVANEKKDPEYYRSEFVVELKYKLGKVSLNLYGPTGNGRTGTVYRAELDGGSNLNEQALKLIRNLPVCVVR